MKEKTSMDYENKCNKMEWEISELNKVIHKLQVENNELFNEKQRMHDELEVFKDDIGLKDVLIAELEVYRGLYESIFFNDKPVRIQVGSV